MDCESRSGNVVPIGSIISRNLFLIPSIVSVPSKIFDCDLSSIFIFPLSVAKRINGSSGTASALLGTTLANSGTDGWFCLLTSTPSRSDYLG